MRLPDACGRFCFSAAHVAAEIIGVASLAAKFYSVHMLAIDLATFPAIVWIVKSHVPSDVPTRPVVNNATNR
jgi:hypothetical protein